MNMKDIPWQEIITLLRFWGYVVIALGAFKLFGLMLTEVCGRFCRHCGKKV